MKNNFIIFFLLFSGLLYSQNDIQLKFNDFENSQELKSAIASFYAYDLENDSVIFAKNEDKSLKPASNLKILTTAAALETFGADYRFSTYLKYSGTIENNILKGNIYIIGGGDPTLGSEYFYKDQYEFIDNWISEIKKMNIKQITGNIIILDTLFKKQNIPETWVWGDIGNYYGAGVSSISIFDNKYKIYFDTKVAIDDTVRILKTMPKLPDVEFDNRVTAKKIFNDRSNIYASPMCNKQVIEGFLPVNKDSFIVKGSILNPAKILSKLVENKLLQKGISFSGKKIVLNNVDLLPELKLIYETQSPELIDIIKQTNLRSINLYAETLLRHLSLSRKGNGSNSHGTSVLVHYWKNQGVDIYGMRLYDGSGLSSYNLITSKEMVQALNHIYKDSLKYKGFINTLPIAGKSGTLTYMFRKLAAKEHIFAKSGSMSSVKAYSGYIFTKNNKTITFSIIFNNYTCNSKIVKTKIEDILNFVYSNY